jgi:hypothetical protein
VSSGIQSINCISLVIANLNKLSFEIFECINWKITKHITLVLVKIIGKFPAFYDQVDCLGKNRKVDEHNKTNLCKEK